MKTGSILSAFPACSRCSTGSRLAAPHPHRKTCRSRGECVSTDAPRRSSKKRRQGHLIIVKAHPELVSYPVPIPEGDWLPNFISWLHANGASGVNELGAKLALFEEDTAAGSPANRGVVFTEAVGNVTEEAPLLRVPLRMGIWDKGAQIHKQCPELTELGCLALALLEELLQGSNSQRWPWLRVLPREVPSLYGSFPLRLHPELEGFVPAADLEKARNRAGRECAAAEPRSSAFCLQQWRWAFSVVHSRALAVPGPDGVVVPMLVPMVDMFNHGNHASSIPDIDDAPVESSSSLAQDAGGPSENVRWQVRQSKDGEWEVQVVATTSAETGEEALFSYGARSQSSAYFLLHYGFVPICNAYDETILFSSLQEVVDWVLQKCLPKTLEGVGKDAVRECCCRATEKAESVAEEALDSAALHPDELDKLPLLKIYAHGGSQAVDGRLVAALQALHGGEEDAEAYARAAVGTRCRELLAQPQWTSLREDLQSLIHESSAWSPYWENTLRKCERAWESQDDGRFKDALCTRGDGTAASSEPMMNVSALRASQKLLLWSYILAVPAQ